MLSDLYPTTVLNLFRQSGADFMETVGNDVLQELVVNILLGENVRSQTEPLTRRRCTEISSGLLYMLIKGSSESPDFLDTIFEEAVLQIDASKKNQIEKRWPAQWSLGLTGKSMDNVLRGDEDARSVYLDILKTNFAESEKRLLRLLGELSGSVRIAGEDTVESQVTWHWFFQLAMCVGCAELAIRGSDKSKYGKLFERLVLGSVLSVLGFKLRDKDKAARVGDFWLSDSNSDRECDATVIVKPGRVARFDIGFIGKGNPEIVRDKISRFARAIEVSGKSHSSKTYIIVDRIPSGKSASTNKLAKTANASVIQMALSYWPRELANELHSQFGWKSGFQGVDNDEEIEKLIKSSMQRIDVHAFLGAT